MLESNNETAGFTFALSLWAWRDWAELKLASGELQRVEELTKLQTALARDAYESTAATYGKTSTLFDAVKFQARILL
ncbi:MAG TPA: hypothetical protein VJ487_19700 [Alphaproteobacteria bacterium]|nr:hypothetical protein [Alphaproteobacteria bacterium]